MLTRLSTTNDASYKKEKGLIRGIIHLGTVGRLPRLLCTEQE